jgi:transcriptional regulator with XRE-family HTH domain
MATIASDAPYREFALRLAGLREKSGMSRSQLAEKCGIAARSIINYENGTRIPFGDTCARMAEAFGITTDELLGVSRAASVKAGAVADMRTFGPKAPERLRQALDTIGSTFAGGELEEEQMEEYVLEMQKMAMLAQQKLREMHTNRRYRETVTAMEEETRKKVEEINQQLLGFSAGN